MKQNSFNTEIDLYFQVLNFNENMQDKLSEHVGIYEATKYK